MVSDIMLTAVAYFTFIWRRRGSRCVIFIVVKSGTSVSITGLSPCKSDKGILGAITLIGTALSAITIGDDAAHKLRFTVDGVVSYHKLQL